MKQLLIALLVTLRLQEITVLANKDCISTLQEFQQSLVNRSVNLDSLQLAFSPTNHPASISFDVHYYFCSESLDANSTTNISCSEIEDLINHFNAEEKRSAAFDEAYKAHTKFSWNASPINLFIRPRLLGTLSLYTFQVEERHVQIVLDQFCETLSANKTLPNISTVVDRSELCNNPPPLLLLLEKVTANVSKLMLVPAKYYIKKATLIKLQVFVFQHIA